MNQLPSSFITTIKGVYGIKGEEWLKQLPRLLEYCEDRWSLKIGDPYQLSYSYVASATNNKAEEYVLKLRVPDKDCKDEEAFLKSPNEEIVRMIDSDIEKGIILLEKLSPGHTLKIVESETEAVHIAANALKSLWKPASEAHEFQHIQDIAKGLKGIRKKYNGETGPLDATLVEKAELWFPELIATMKNEVLLHGDFHHENILLHGQEWKIIDPKGLIGDAEYDVTNFLRNHLSHYPNQKEVLLKRIDAFVEVLNLNRERLLKWGLCQVVLSAWWFLEDNLDGWEEDMSIAKYYLEIIEETAS
ncbi:aminoglycoside phosphotransferase family protein [Cytobacillus horneckiae]|uniref:aminoglycoside phosphotransferase family protein n=1 Tax=Cytobacillus horneckiae TaxID=549687 RepID=UPI003D9A5498